MDEDFMDVARTEAPIFEESNDVYLTHFTLNCGTAVQMVFELTRKELEEIYKHFEKGSDRDCNKRIRLGEFDSILLDNIVTIQTTKKSVVYAEKARQEARSNLVLPGTSQRNH